MIAGYLAYRLAQGGTPTGGPLILHGTDILHGPYPKSFTDFIGQDMPRLQIMTAIHSALKRRERMDHVLLASGIPGIGKTTLGRLIAYELEVGFLELGGSVSDKDAIKALRSMSDGDVLFLDEIHRLVAHGKAKAEWLLTLLQDGTVQTPTGSFTAPKITVVAATTDAQKLPATILDRFPIQPLLAPYSAEEAREIAFHTARRMGFGSKALEMPEQTVWLERVAAACDNNPRRMGSVLTAVRDIALSPGLQILDPVEGYKVDMALEWLGLSHDGLTKKAQEYLVGLWVNGGTASQNTIKALLAEEQLGQTETALIAKGYVTIGGKGRELTDYGTERARQLVDAIQSTTTPQEN